MIPFHYVKTTVHKHNTCYRLLIFGIVHPYDEFRCHPCHNLHILLLNYVKFNNGLICMKIFEELFSMCIYFIDSNGLLFFHKVIISHEKYAIIRILLKSTCLFKTSVHNGLSSDQSPVHSLLPLGFLSFINYYIFLSTFSSYTEIKL